MELKQKMIRAFSHIAQIIIDIWLNDSFYDEKLLMTN